MHAFIHKFMIKLLTYKLPFTCQNMFIFIYLFEFLRSQQQFPGKIDIVNLNYIRITGDLTS